MATLRGLNLFVGSHVRQLSLECPNSEYESRFMGGNALRTEVRVLRKSRTACTEQGKNSFCIYTALRQNAALKPGGTY